jgi:hypothetical protein
MITLARPNARRAKCARFALTTYCETTGSRFGQYAICDLLADIGHLCDEQGLAYLDVLDSALRHWQAERAGRP